MAFGSILDGPDPAKLQTYVETALPLLITAMDDARVEVRDSTAWTVGRILEICPEIVGHAQLLTVSFGNILFTLVCFKLLLPAFSRGLSQEPRVAANICWALMSLVRAAYELGKSQGTDSTGEPETFVLSSVFPNMIDELIRIADRYFSLIYTNQFLRTDGNQSNLRLAAFETIMELIKNSPKDCYHVVQNTTILMLDKLEKLLQLENNASAADRVCGLFFSELIFVECSY